MGGCGVNYTFEGNTSCVLNGFSMPMNLYLNLYVTIAFLQPLLTARRARAPSSDWVSSIPVGSYDPTTITNPQPAYYIPERQ